MHRVRSTPPNVSLTDTCSDDRPQKRLKVISPVLDSVAVLNDCGITSFCKENYVEARQCFSQALSGIDVEFLCESIQSSIVCTEEKFELMKSSMYSSEETTTSLPLTPPTSPLAPSSYEPQTLLYIYQRHDYDEGMEVNDMPLMLPPALMINSRPSTLFYNIALTYIRQGQYEMAAESFGKALSRIKASVTDFSCLVVKLLHGLGSVSYTHLTLPTKRIV